MPLLANIPPLKKRRTKIIATIGPACEAPERLREMFIIGVDVFRLNMSHGDHATHQRNYTMIRQQAERENRHITILADLCGPKIRCGEFRDGRTQLIDGDEVVVTTEAVLGDRYLIPSQYAALPQDVEPGQRILLNDGLLELRVLTIDGQRVRCQVVHGGELSDHKGINLPDSVVSAAAMTDKDRRDARFAQQLGVDFLALSFVRSADDVQLLRHYIDDANIGIIAKIERPEALQQAEAITAAADGIMVARGDLGVEIPAEQVPLAQQMLIDTARRLDKPVIVATQMLESMMHHPRATRAEVTDVFHSVNDGTDAVMLSAETAAGRYPMQAASAMDRIIRYAEACLWEQSGFARLTPVPPQGTHAIAPGDALAEAMALMSRRLMVRAVVVFSPTGVTARAMAAARPEAPMLAVSPSARVCRRLNLLWGVIAVQADEAQMQQPCALASTLTKRFALAAAGQSILLVRGFHRLAEKNTPTITIVTVH